MIDILQKRDESYNANQIKPYTIHRWWIKMVKPAMKYVLKTTAFETAEPKDAMVLTRSD